MQENKKFSPSFQQIAGLLLLLIFTACTNWKEEPAISKMIFINALPGNKQASLVFDGQPLNPEPLAYSGFTNGYRNIRAGRRNVAVILADNTTPLAEGTLDVPEFRNFTTILAQYVSKNTVRDTIIIYPDTLNKPASGKANIRLINMYSEKDATLDVLVPGQANALFANRKFLNISGFVAADTASRYTFTLRKNGTAIEGTYGEFPISRQLNYSLLITDSLITATGERKPNLKLITHQ